MPRLGKRVVLLRLFYGGEVRKCDCRAAIASAFDFPPDPQEPYRPDPVLGTRRAAAPSPPAPIRRSVSGSAWCKTRGAFSLCRAEFFRRRLPIMVLAQLHGSRVISSERRFLHELVTATKNWSWPRCHSKRGSISDIGAGAVCKEASSDATAISEEDW